MALIEGLNYVESTIIEEILDTPSPTNTATATIIFGTARKGRTRVLRKVTYGDVATQYGTVPNLASADFETNAVHAAVAIQASTQNRDKDMYIYKVGDSSTAKLSLYEMRVTDSGDLSYSFDDEGNPIVSMIFESLEEDEISNNTRVTVRGESGIPSSLTVELPDGYRRVFNMDPYGVRPGLPANVRELTDLILGDEQIAAVLDVRFTRLSKTNLPVIVQNDGIPFIEVDAVGLNESWGDKLLDIKKVKEELNYSETIQPGKVSNRLKFAPNKDEDPLTATITTFRKKVKDEQFIKATLAQVGATTHTKSILLSSPGIAWNTNIGTVNFTAIKQIRGGVVTDITVGTTISLSIAGDLTLSSLPAFQVGDEIKITYNFGAALIEANTKSELVIGNENSYFVAGNNILFGAAPTLELELTFDAIKEFVASDLNLIDRETIRINFINPALAPATGATVYVDFEYLPEFPAPSGDIVQDQSLTNSYVQESGLKGGTSGSFITRQRYKELVEEAMDDTMLVPFRRVIVSGAYLDEVVDGINEETGLPGKVALNWGALLKTKLEFKSKVSGECSTVLGVKPLSIAEINKGEVAINKWYSYLLDNFSDPFSAATAISALSSYHIDVALGVMYASDIQIFAGAQFLENPAYVVCGMQLDSRLSESLIRQNVPGYVKRLLVTFPSGTIVGRLNTARYTTLHLSPQNEIRIADAPTAAAFNSNMGRQLVRDTVYAGVRVARDIAAGYIGLRRDATNLNLMEQRVNRDVIEAFVPDYMSIFRANILPVAGGHISGATKMRLFIETSVEIRQVFFETTVKLGGENL